MSRFFSLWSRSLVVIAGLAVIASAANLARAEWAYDHPPMQPAPTEPTAYAALSPAAKVEALQRQLDGLKAHERASAEAHAATSRADALLLFSTLFLSLCIVLMAFQCRSVSRAGVKGV